MDFTLIFHLGTRRVGAELRQYGVHWHVSLPVGDLRQGFALRRGQAQMKRALQAFVALLLLWLVVRNVDVKSLANSLGHLRLWSIVGAIGLFFFACGLGATKWRMLWRKATWWQMLNANFAAQFYSVVLPGQLVGEIVKTLRVGHRFSDTTNVAVSVLVDRAVGLVGLLVLALVGALLSTSTVASDAILVLCPAVVGVLGLLYAITIPGICRATFSVIERIGNHRHWLQNASRRAIEFLSAWAALMSKTRMTLAAIGLGIAYQAICVGINFLIASDIGISVGFADWCWIFGVVSVALLLPITIAGIGVREGAYAGLLSLYGVSIDKAVVVSIVVFGISLLGAVAGGIVEFAYTMRAREDLPR